MKYIDVIKEANKETLLQVIKSNHILSHGNSKEPVYDQIVRFQEKEVKVKEERILAGGLSNNDFSHILLQYILADPRYVMAGFLALSKILELDRILLYLPEEESSRKLVTAANEAGIHVEIVNDIIDTRLLRDGFISHLLTLDKIGRSFDGNFKSGEPLEIILKSKNTETSLTKGVVFAEYGSVYKNLIKEKLEYETIKAVKLGHTLYDISVLDEELGENTPLVDGRIILYDNTVCMVSETEKKLKESRKHSCGKCTFCREGLFQLYSKTHEITSAKSISEEMENIMKIADAMKFSSMCSIGTTGSSIFLETTEKFANEYSDHIKKKKCTASSCLAFINIYINPQTCTGCGDCIPLCPIDCIEGLPGYIHMIEDIDCIKCGKCITGCKENAIVQTENDVMRLPDRLTPVGRFKRY